MLEINKKQLRQHIAEVVEKYIESRGFHDSEVTINGWLLNSVIDSSIHDINRMSDFHIPKDNTPDRHKYAGYVSKWIARIRPIQFLQTAPLNQENESKIWANSELAVFIFISFLKLDGKKFPMALFDSLKYSFTYRNEEGSSLAVLAYSSELPSI